MFCDIHLGSWAASWERDSCLHCALKYAAAELAVQPPSFTALTRGTRHSAPVFHSVNGTDTSTLVTLACGTHNQPEGPRTVSPQHQKG